MTSLMKARWPGMGFVICAPVTGPAAQTDLVFTGSFESTVVESDAPDGWAAAGNPVEANVSVLCEAPVSLLGANADLVERASP